MADDNAVPEGAASSGRTPPACSLDILLPKASAPRTTSSTRSPDAALLERLSTELIRVFCSQDWTNPLLQHATSNFSSYIDHSQIRTRTFAEHVAWHKRLHAQHPNYVYQVQNASAAVDDEKGTASVWALLKVTGMEEGIARESITVFWWRRAKGKWTVYRQIGIRGANTHGSTWLNEEEEQLRI